MFMKVAFIGHRHVKDKEKAAEALNRVLFDLIENENADTFLFGSKSEFNDLCYEAVTRIRKKYTHLKRIYVRAEYEFIDDDYEKYLLSDYEETFYPREVVGAGVKAYVVRNRVMVDGSDCIVFYCSEGYSPAGRKSGTKAAYDYARSKDKRIINIAIALT